MKNTILTLTASLLFGTLLLSSCSVKEDRRPCPCYLEVQVPSFGESGFLSIYDLATKGLVYRQYLDENSEQMEIALPKAYYQISGLWGVNKSQVTDDAVIIPLGQECDSLYSFTSLSLIDATGEQAFVAPTPHKQFATLSLDFETQSYYPFELTVRGNIDGYNLYDCSPHEGDFLVKPVPLNELNSKFSLRLPRQVDNSLIIELREKSTKAGESEPFIISLGEIIARTNYDWNAEDLEDISIYIDYVQKQITINVCDWEIVFSISMEI